MQYVEETTSQIRQPTKHSVPQEGNIPSRKITKSLRGFTYEECLKALKKRRLRKELALTTKQIHLETIYLFKISKGTRLRRLSPTRRRKKMQGCKARELLATCSCIGTRAAYVQKYTLLIYLAIIFALYFILAPIWTFGGNISLSTH